MLVKLTELLETEGFFEDGTREVAIDPLLIDSIKPTELQGYDGPCCVLVIPTEERPLVAAGTLDELLATLQQAEYDAQVKLDSIRRIIEAT